MAGSPDWKIYTREGEYIASAKYPEDAAAIVAMRGEGTTIRYGHNKRDIVWTEGQGADGEAGESYDAVAATCYQRKA